MERTDDELLRLVQQRDLDAFDLLFARYKDVIHRHIIRMVRDEQVANDMLQDVFIRVWTHAHQWDQRGTPKGWLFRIATNATISHMRTPRHTKESSLDEAFSAEDASVIVHAVESSRVGPEMQALIGERRASLQALIARMPPSKRTVFRMMYEEDMDVREVAAALGIPEGTVKSRLHYARLWLAHAWRSLHAEYEEE